MQPDVTARDTTGAHPLCVGDDRGASEQVDAEDEPALPDLKPWRHAGWIFRDGDCVAIERQADELDRRARILAD